MSQNTPSEKIKSPLAPTRKIRKRRVVIALLLVLGAAFGTLAVLNRDVDPTEWKGVRSGYENTK